MVLLVVESWHTGQFTHVKASFSPALRHPHKKHPLTVPLVIPSETDYPSAPLTTFNAWWHIFQGLHAVVGYRTEMYIADGVTTPFGGWIGEGVPVVTAWLSAVHGDSAFYGSNPTYFDGNRQMTEPLGRASTIYVCGHLNDVVWNTANLGAATCLTETWYNN
jgi:hypothetical protein